MPSLKAARGPRLKLGAAEADIGAVLVPDARFERIDTMTGVEFEQALVDLFRLLGTRVSSELVGSIRALI